MNPPLAKTPILHFCLIGVVVSIIGPVVNGFVPVIASCILLVIYTVWAARAAGASLSIAANHVFLLGHLYTLSGLLGAATQLRGGSPEFDSDPRRMFVIVAALKLSTSVVGLIGMFYLTSKAEEDDFTSGANRVLNASMDGFPFAATPSEQDQWKNAKEAIFAETSDVAAELRGFQQTVVSFGHTLTQANEHLAQLKIQTTNAGTAFLVLEDKARKSAKRLEDATAEMKTFSSGFLELERVLDDFAQVIENRIDLAQQ